MTQTFQIIEFFEVLYVKKKGEFILKEIEHLKRFYNSTMNKTRNKKKKLLSTQQRY